MNEIKTQWDLAPLFTNRNEYAAGIERVNTLAQEILVYKDRLTESASVLLEALKLNDELGILFGRLYVYARLSFDRDMSEQSARKIYEEISLISQRLGEELAFFEPELLTMSEDRFNDYLTEESELSTYEFMFRKLFQKQAHILDKDTEEILTRLSSLGSSFEKIYDDLTVLDTDYPEVSGSDPEFRLKANNANYQLAMINKDRLLRKNYFQALLSLYGERINTLTSTYYGNVKYDVYLARTRNYSSARRMALHRSFIPDAVYDNLIKVVRERSDVLERYLALRKNVLQLDELHFYDLFVPLAEVEEKKYTIEEAEEIVLEALSVLGDDYLDIIREAFRSGKIDAYPGDSKATGAYAIHTYGVHPYVMLNYTGTLEDIFTIAHELGHMMHSYYSMNNQPYVDSGYSIFTAEVASTVNEHLLFRYLVENAASDTEKAVLISKHLDGIRSTFYRQTIFADFEHEVHTRVENGQPLLPDELCEYYEGLYRIYYGSGFTIDEELKYEWARIPHFYRAFYVYQYATGIAAATSLAKGILSDGAAVEHYREFLSSGGSDYSIELLKKAGVDMSSPEPVLDLVEHFSSSLTLLEDLLAK